MDDLMRDVKDFLYSFRSIDDAGDIDTLIDMQASVCWRTYKCLINYGFTPDQAIKIVARMETPLKITGG